MVKDITHDLAVLPEGKSLELTILRKIGEVLSSEMDIEQVLSRIIDACRELVSAEGWSILLKDKKRDELVFTRIHGKKKAELANMKIKVGQGIAGKVAESGEPKIVNDVTTDADFYPGIDQSIGFETRSILCIPLISRGKVLGVIEIINKPKGKKFSETDLKKVQIFTNFASIALENAQLYEQALVSAITDDLTGLYNNRFINHKLSVELQIAKKKKQSLGFIFIDLDHFKYVNDNYGHIAGSGLLKAVADFIRDRVGKQTDMIARYGGDEFLIVVPKLNAEKTYKLAEQLRKNLADELLIIDDDIQTRITASFGIAAYPEQAESLEELIGMADKAMYEVKERNRNGVKIFSKDLQ
ncbi:MAG: sensor domain-containing diguanylate cyclase [Acidobacteria bacterium]|nr:sensor domain-containing diguanylate cyclase [Acidobacteriota bacterium]